MALGAVLFSGHVWQQPALNQLRTVNTGQRTYERFLFEYPGHVCRNRSESPSTDAHYDQVCLPLIDNVQNAPRQGIKRRQD